MGAGLNAQKAAPDPTSSLNTFLIICEWVFILSAIGLWMAVRTYHPLMNFGLGLWAGAWVARWLRLRKLTRLTPLDLPILAFFASVAIGRWAAPNQWDAAARALLFLGAIGLYYAVVNSDLRTLTVVCFGFLAGAAVFGIYFATQHPWAEQPAKFELLQKAGLFLNRAVPDLAQYKPHPNVVAGLVAMGLATWSALFYHQITSQIRQPITTRQAGRWVALLIIGAVLLFAMVMTQSRSAWLATAGTVALGMAWPLAGWLAKRVGLGQWVVYAIGLGIGLAIVAGVIFAQPQLISTALGTLPGPNSVVSRVEIYGQVWRLAQDTPFTGGGLAAFPGLYSTYVLSVPSLYLTHAHNSFLNILLEQGWLGGISFLVIVFGTAIFALPRLERLDSGWSSLVGAGCLGAVAVLLQGLGDATLVASRVTPFLFLPAGLVFASPSWQRIPVRQWVISAVPLVVLMGTALVFVWPVSAQWQANLGAVAQNRVLLTAWPTNEWDTGENVTLLAPAEAHLKQALVIAPDNDTALYRLGMIAMLKQDWPQAASYLQTAQAHDPHRHVLTKTLGYTYAWLGDFEKAQPLLLSLPETRDELAIYAWWWNERMARPNLSQNAILLLKRMSESTP
jgi:O-antigen ligase